MKTIVTAGCGEQVDLVGGVCEAHEERVDFDGFTVNWHVEYLSSGRRMWRNGPSIRPSRRC